MQFHVYSHHNPVESHIMGNDLNDLDKLPLYYLLTSHHLWYILHQVA